MLTYDDLRVAALDLPGTDPRTIVEQRRATLAGTRTSRRRRCSAPRRPARRRTARWSAWR